MDRFTKQYSAWSAAVMLLSLGACSDDAASPEIDATAAQRALDEVTLGVDSAVTSFSAANPPSNVAGGTPPRAHLDVACPAGGMARLDGYVDVVPRPIHVDIKVAITYYECMTRSTLISGDLEFSQAVDAAADALRIETIYTGDVQLRGAVNARCEVDLSVVVDETGRALELAGRFCGYDANTLAMHLTPRWGTDDADADD